MPKVVITNALVIFGLLSATPAFAKSIPLSERFADIPNLGIETPAFPPAALSANRKDFTTDAESTQFIAKLAAQNPNLYWTSLGRTPGGRELNMMIFTADGRFDPQDVANSRKPIVWIMGLQHGNEPAGGEAILDIARRLGTQGQGDLRSVLDKVTVVLLPRANPDGAAGFKRETTKGDLNRDHLSLGLPENVLIHKAMRDYPPAVVVDAHEFTASGRWVDKYGTSQASDVLTQFASHPGVSDAVRRMGKEIFEPALTATFAQHQLRSYVYHTLNVNNTNAFVQMGGNFAGIARNTFGLYGAVSILLETRGVGIGRDHYQRRVGTHVLAMSAVLRTAAQNDVALRSIARETRKTPTGEWIVDHGSKRETRSLPMFDPQSGEDKNVSVEFQNSNLVVNPVLRPVPAGYVLSPNTASDALRSLLAHGLRVNRVLANTECELDFYILNKIGQDAGEFGAPMEKWGVDMKRGKRTVEAGSFFVPMAQPNSRIAAAALEPEGVGSFASLRMLQDTAILLGQELPLWRLPLLNVTSNNATNNNTSNECVLVGPALH